MSDSSSSVPAPSAPAPEKEMSTLRAILHPAVIVGALGYFVDIYDLTLFSIVRVASLKDLGFAGEELVSHGLALLNIQMIGMLLGGIAFGVLGDRVGRVALLFSSILLYSVANIANGMVDTFGAYAFWRFVAGFGLAGELGGCITLVSEVLPKSKRGFGTAVVAGVGVMGAVFGEWVSRNVSTWGIFPDDVASWRICFYIGGGMGLALLALRVGVVESGLFKTLKQAGGGAGHGIKRGDFLALFRDGTRFLRFARCILIGVPSWFVVGVLATLAPELGRALQLTGEVTAGRAVSCVYLGLTLGDFASGFLSQWFGTRKKIVLAFIIITAAAAGTYLLSHGQSPTWFYTVCFALGVGIGYWAVFATIAAEHFGTNLRATVATTVPNFVRASIVPITFTFQWLKSLPGVGPLWAAAVVGALSIAVALWALRGLEETHGKDLDYLET